MLFLFHLLYYCYYYFVSLVVLKERVFSCSLNKLKMRFQMQLGDQFVITVDDLSFNDVAFAQKLNGLVWYVVGCFLKQNSEGVSCLFVCLFQLWCLAFFSLPFLSLFFLEISVIVFLIARSCCYFFLFLRHERRNAVTPMLKSSFMEVLHPVCVMKEVRRERPKEGNKRRQKSVQESKTNMEQLYYYLY